MPKAREEVDESSTDHVYWVSIECLNCLLHKSLAFTKGTEINLHRCPNCECSGSFKKTGDF